MFTDDDERLIVLFAAHAAIAIENARLHERSRELTIVEERNRLARELHDSVTQQLFAVTLAAQSAGELLARDGPGARQLARVGPRARRDGGAALGGLRAAPGALEAEGLARALGKHVEVLRRVSGRRSSCAIAAPPRLGAPRRAGQVFRIAQEALQNALRHAGAARIEVGSRTAAGRSCSPSPTTAAASTPASPGRGRGGSG